MEKKGNAINFKKIVFLVDNKQDQAKYARNVPGI